MLTLVTARQVNRGEAASRRDPYVSSIGPAGEEVIWNDK